MTPLKTSKCNSDAMASFAAPFCSQTFLHNAELEFRWLLSKLGYDEWTADLRAFQMTAQLGLEVRRFKELWESANTEVSDRRPPAANPETKVNRSGGSMD